MKPYHIVDKMAHCLFCGSGYQKRSGGPMLLTPGVHQCLECSYHPRPGMEGPRTLFDCKVRTDGQLKFECQICTSKRQTPQAYIEAATLIYDPSDFAALEHTPGKSDFVLRFRDGWMCSECGWVHWSGDTEEYMRLSEARLREYKEEIPQIPDTWEPGIVTCSPSSYVAQAGPCQ